MLASLAITASFLCSEAKPQDNTSEKDLPDISLEQILSSGSVTNIGQATNLYYGKDIALKIDGNLKASFDVVNEFAKEYELLSKLAECLVDSKISLRKQKDGSYIYLNKESKNTSKLWVMYELSSDDKFAGLYYFTGKKLFFEFYALLYIRSCKKEDGGIMFSNEIYAGTSSSIANWFSRLSIVKDMISSESSQVISKFDSIYLQMMKAPEENMKKVMRFTDPKGDIYFGADEIAKIRSFYQNQRR